MEQVEDLVKQSLLYDYYCELLTKQQRKIYEEVFFDDYSISEVARDEKISRQGVYDMIKRTKEALLDYEEKLGLVKKHLERKEIFSDIEVLAKALKEKAKAGDEKSLDSLLKKIEKLQDI